MSADSTGHFERADDLAGAVTRQSGDRPLVEVVHGLGAYSRFSSDATCGLRTHDNGRPAVVVELDEGDGWFDAAGSEAVIEVRRGAATVVATGSAAVAVKGERDRRTIVVAVSGTVTLQPADGEQVALRQQAAMLDDTGHLVQVVDVSDAQVATEPWIARNRALAPMPPPVVSQPEAEAEPDAAAEPAADLAAEPEAAVAPDAGIEPEVEADAEAELEAEVEPNAEAAAEPDAEAGLEAEPAVEPEVEPAAAEVDAEAAAEPEIDPEESEIEPEIEAEPAAIDPEPEPEPEAEPTVVVRAVPAPERVGDVLDDEDDDDELWVPVDDDERSGGRRWARAAIVGLLLIAALGLLLPRGGGSSDDTDTDADTEAEVSSADVTPSTIDVATTDASPPAGTPDDPAAPAGEEDGGVEIPRGDLPARTELIACRRSAGQVAFDGRLTNIDDVDHRYRLHVVFTDAAGARVERTTIDLTVAPDDTRPWSVTSSAGERLQGGSCDLERVELLTD